MPAGLDPRQMTFITEYLRTGNGMRAALAAGYTERSASTASSRLLKRPAILRELEARRSRLADRYDVTADRIIRELALMGFANMQDYMKFNDVGDPVLDFSGLTRDQAAALIEVTVDTYMDGRGDDAKQVKRVRFKLADKLSALEKLGKHLGLFADKHVHTGPNGGPIQIEVEEVNYAREEIARRINELVERQREAERNSAPLQLAGPSTDPAST